MMAAFLAPLVIFPEQSASFWLLQALQLAGAALAAWSLWRLYVRQACLKGLITDGPFRYTRHPTYLGFLLTNVSCWAQPSVWMSPLFLSLEAIFIISMVLASYCQEQEILERFGQKAVDYLKRTPRIPFAPW